MSKICRHCFGRGWVVLSARGGHRLRFASCGCLMRELLTPQDLADIYLRGA